MTCARNVPGAAQHALAAASTPSTLQQQVQLQHTLTQRQQVEHLLRIDHSFPKVRHEACAGPTPSRDASAAPTKSSRSLQHTESAPINAVFHLFAIFVNVVEPVSWKAWRGRRHASRGAARGSSPGAMVKGGLFFVEGRDATDAARAPDDISTCLTRFSNVLKDCSSTCGVASTAS